MAELPVCTSTRSLGGLVACLVPPVLFLLWVGGSLHLAELGAEVWEAPGSTPIPDSSLTPPRPPQLVLTPGSWQGAGRGRRGGCWVGGRGLTLSYRGCLAHPATLGAVGGTPGSALGCTLVEGFVLSSCSEVAEQGRLGLMRQVPGLQTLRSGAEIVPAGGLPAWMCVRR